MLINDELKEYPVENRTPSLCSALCAEKTIVSSRTFSILELRAGEKRPLFLACQLRQCQCVVLPLLSAPDWPELCGFWQAEHNCPPAPALQRKQMASQPPSSRSWPCCCCFTAAATCACCFIWDAEEKPTLSPMLQAERCSFT